MPRVHHRKATKGEDIKKGEMYYTWSRKTGPYSSFTGKQKERPHRAQLTGSAFLGSLYYLEDEVSAFTGDADELSELAGRIRTLGEEAIESLENMPEGLQQSSTGELLQERSDAMDSWSDELDNYEYPEEDDGPEGFDEAIAQFHDDDQGCAHDI